MIIRFAGVFLIALVVAACSDSDVAPKRDLTKQLREDRFGYELPKLVAVDKYQNLMWIQNVVANYQRPDSNKAIKRIEQLEATSGCSFPTPSEDELVQHVYSGDSNQKAALYLLNDSQIDKRAQALISNWQREGEEPMAAHRAVSSDAMKVVDVVITESEKSVYLVLSGSYKTLWNIVKAPYAKISRVALVGIDKVAIANLGDDVPVSYLLSKANRNCKNAPFRRPAEHWRMVQRSKKRGNSHILEAVQSRYRVYSDFDAWFHRSFNQSSEDDIAGMERVSHVLVGPMPQQRNQRIPFKPLEGAVIRVSTADHAFYGSKSAYNEQIDNLVTTRAKELVGGDLTALNWK